MKSKTILVVDDDADLREAFSDIFTLKGAHVFVASGGHEAMKIVTQNKIDLVLSDVRMPNGSGVELLDEIKKHNSAIPVVLLITGFADISAAEAKTKGAFALLEKPINQLKLLELVNNALQTVPST